MGLIRNHKHKKKKETYEVFRHLVDSFIWDGKPELFLRNGKIQPQLPPSEEPVLKKKKTILFQAQGTLKKNTYRRRE